MQPRLWGRKVYARKRNATGAEGAAGAPRIRVEVPDLSIVVEVPGVGVLPVSSPKEGSLPGVENEAATVWVEDVLTEGPSSALSV